MKTTLHIIIACVIFAQAISCSNNDKIYKKHFFRMNTITEVTVLAAGNFDVKKLWQSVDSLLRQSENRFSVSGQNSEVRILNERGDATAMPVSSELCEMIRAGINYGDTLGGAFDITVLPLKKLWGFCEECEDDAPLPTDAQIADALKHVDYRAVTISAACDTVFFASLDTRIDVGGVAKGFVLRRLARLIEDHGVYDYLIAAGGDITASGVKRRAAKSGDGGDPWLVGVRHPRDVSSLVATFPLRGGAVVTSGDYERYRVVDGERYHHIFDTKTGRSCGVNQSVTISANDPVVADILSTGLFCFSAAEILSFVGDRENIGVIVVDSVGSIFKFFADGDARS